MTDIEFAKLLGEIDEELIWECRPNITDRAPKKPRRTLPRFLSRAASVAAAAVLALFISTATAEAAGVRVVTPFVSWTGSALRLDYSAGLDQHADAPEITADPSHKPVVSSIPSERIRFTSEEEFKARVGNMMRLPGEELGLEFVEASGNIDIDGMSIAAVYRINGKEIRIKSHYYSDAIDPEYSSRTLIIKGASRYDSKVILGIECSLIYAKPWNYITAEIENESYLVFGEVEMDVLESIMASILASK